MYLWLLYIYVVLDSTFAFVAAYASDATIAQTLAIPLLLVFVGFAGAMPLPAQITPVLRPVVNGSPLYWTLLAILTHLLGDDPSAKQDLAIFAGITLPVNLHIATGVNAAYFVFFRILQLVSLIKFNNIR